MKQEELEPLLKEHWKAQCAMIGEENFKRVLREVEKGNTKPEKWAIKTSGGTPMDFALAYMAISAAISFIQLVITIRGELRKQGKAGKAEELKADLSKMILEANSPEQKILASERGQRIIDELAGKQ